MLKKGGSLLFIEWFIHKFNSNSVYNEVDLVYSLFLENKRHSRHASINNWKQTVFIILYLCVSCLKRGVFHENLHMFCVVLLKSAFFLTICVFGSHYFLISLEYFGMKMHSIKMRCFLPFHSRGQQHCGHTKSNHSLTSKIISSVVD